MDLLSPLFNRFTLSARVFHAGLHCGVEEFRNNDGMGILHVLRRGHLRVCRPGQPALDLDVPTLLLCRQPLVHRFEVDAREGVDLVCSVIDFGPGPGSPVLRGLPEMLVVPTADLPAALGATDLLFSEAFAQHAGREAALDRLVEYVLVLLLRHTLSAGLVRTGVLAALADPRLCKAVLAMHERPGEAWTLERLAQCAGMSRARFAVHFRDAVGLAPLDYLTDWRLCVAQTLLRRGQAMKWVAPAVGYASPIALARVFARRLGMPPTAWLAAQGKP